MKASRSSGTASRHSVAQGLYARFAAAIYIILFVFLGITLAAGQVSAEPLEEVPNVMLPEQGNGLIEGGLAPPTSGKASQLTRRERQKRENHEACEGREDVIHLIVRDVRSEQGTITADLHGDRPEEFLKKGAKILRVRQPAEVGQVELCLPAPGPGTYAIGLYHDENANRRLDKNFLGIPTEPLGISRNPAIIFGPPSHADSAFSVGPAGITLEIVLKY